MNYVLDNVRVVVRIVAGITCLIFGAISPAGASQSAMVSWKPSSNTNAVAYEIYYGIESGNYTKAITVGNVTTATVSGLAEGTTYFFAARAVDTSGAESTFSPEVTYTVPSLAATLESPFPTSNGFSFNVNGIAGNSYVVQVSSNLSDWISVLTNTAPFTFQDSHASEPGQKFYRSVYYP